MECKIFYSWQSDLPNSTNRGFIQEALEKAAKVIRNDKSIEIEPVIDRDTAGVPGSPDIADTILFKIENSQIFVADVSIINSQSPLRKAPNPNVLVELGYAMQTPGLGRIIMVMNTAHGKPEVLPFDLRMRRIVSYEIAEGEKDKAAERKKLTAFLEQAIREILKNPYESKNDNENSLNAVSIDPITLDKVQRCSSCGYTYRVKNSAEIPSSAVRIFTTTCKKCGNVDDFPQSFFGI